MTTKKFAKDGRSNLFWLSPLWLQRREKKVFIYENSRECEILYIYIYIFTHMFAAASPASSKRNGPSTNVRLPWLSIWSLFSSYKVRFAEIELEGYWVQGLTGYFDVVVVAVSKVEIASMYSGFPLGRSSVGIPNKFEAAFLGPLSAKCKSRTLGKFSFLYYNR